MEIIRLSSKEIRNGEIVSKIIEGKMSQSQAAILLELSVRQIKRLCKKYRAEGIKGLAHKNRGKPSNHSISTNLKEEVLQLIREKYPDFTYQLIHERLQETHGISLSAEWVRQTMIKEGDRRVEKRKKIKCFQLRTRRSRRGELIQIDGSYHLWFEERGPKCCLLVSIDDATSELCELRFVEHESTQGYMELIKSYVKNRGKPIAFYSDRLNIFKETGSQLRRSLKELDITLINANSPQAKGRVERANGTLQDRLIKLMRLENISTIEAGNEFLQQYISDHNKRFGRQPKIDEDAHKPYSEDLNTVLCIKEKRKVTKDLMVHCNNKVYALETNGMVHRLRGKTALVSEVSGVIRIEIEGKEYKYKIYEEMPYLEPMNRKQTDAWIDRKKPLTVKQRIARGMSVNF